MEPSVFWKKPVKSPGRESIHSRENILWCSFEGKPSSSAIQKPLSFISEVTSGVTKVSVEDDYFITAEVHNQYHMWEQILHGFHKKEVLKYISKGMSVFNFFKPFKGDFKGKSYDSQLPPKMFFKNNKICNEYEDLLLFSLEQFLE